MKTAETQRPASTKPICEKKIERDVMAAMRDGVRLAVDVYRPDAPGTFPALLSITAYDKAVEQVPIPHSGSQEYALCEAGDPDFWATRGYAHVIADTRGTGQSGGTFEGAWLPQEAQDAHDLVEWIAAQDWCDGNVGMISLAYMATGHYRWRLVRPARPASGHAS